MPLPVDLKTWIRAFPHHILLGSEVIVDVAGEEPERLSEQRGVVVDGRRLDHPVCELEQTAVLVVDLPIACDQVMSQLESAHAGLPSRQFSNGRPELWSPI